MLGPKTARAFGAVGVHTLDDLMHYTPRHYLHGTQRSDLRALLPGERAAVLAEVASTSSQPVKGDPRRWRLEAGLTDGHGRLKLIFFGKKHLVEYWRRQLSMGSRGIFVGKIGEFRGELQMNHPDFVMLDDDGRIVGAADEKKAQMAQVVSRGEVIGIYPARAALPTWQIAECVAMGLDALAGIDDPLPEQIRSGEELPGLLEAFTMVHQPRDGQDVASGMRRLKFDEALGLQLTMAYRRREAASQAAAAIAVRPDGLLAAFDARLSFRLTGGQQEVSAEILADMASERPMQRLLQGEVGSGKTIVALRAMLAVVDSGRQAVMLAPTEVLAAQHAATIRSLMGELAAGGTLGAPEHSTGVELLTGSMPPARRRAVLDEIASGRAGVVIGTHALLGEGIRFAGLGLVVIDEQHRFGVEQRARLTAGGRLRPHELVLTATPIPRSVAMTVFGDLAVSTLRALPDGRADVQTTAVLTAEHPSWMVRVWARLREEVRAGRQGFVVCPRIGGSDEGPRPGGTGGDSETAGAEETYAGLAAGELAGLRLGLLHGRQGAETKSATMAAFTRGELDVLVSTTIIEVGLDVPNASTMVVLDADRLGVSQLHQLRGRIGRGAFPGVCLLVSAVDPRTPAAQRLRDVASTRDGFALAELDLAQRREGDVLGAEQSGGRSSLRLLRVLDDADVIVRARTVADALARVPAGELPDGPADMIRRGRLLSADEWLERD
ncbi:ATP-dependent DNA helicase RecG [uncultured Propionibacterium sp.]|uniref:ATP-dependent DNA helicase RecG n=1 Tax=uncultured Propionibacterium sp. TaxID=218066 RepID=UPI0037DC7C18